VPSQKLENFVPTAPVRFAAVNLDPSLLYIAASLKPENFVPTVPVLLPVNPVHLEVLNFDGKSLLIELAILFFIEN
jgi:hypothetical protein